MGFDDQELSLQQRAAEKAPHDAEIRLACLNCRYQSICGGFWVWDDSRWCDEDCLDCPRNCCHRACWHSDAERLGGLGFDDITWTPWSIDWPDLIWMVGGRTGDLPEPVYIIPVDSLMDRYTLNWAQTPDLHARFSIPAASKIGISFCFQDWLLDHFKGNEDAVADEVAKFSPDFVLPINYSAYRNFPRLSQLMSMRRRMLSLKAFQDRGLRVIPDVGPIRGVDADRWADWVLREKCPAVFFTAQTLKGRDWKIEYHIQFDPLVRLRERLGPDVRFLIQGVSARRMSFFESHLGKVSFVNHAAWVKAELRIGAVGGERLREQGLSVQQAFALNIQKLKAMLFEIRSKAISSSEGELHG